MHGSYLKGTYIFVLLSVAVFSVAFDPHDIWVNGTVLVSFQGLIKRIPGLETFSYLLIEVYKCSSFKSLNLLMERCDYL